MPVCIAGVHRSGTSMTAKLLHLCGISLGDPQDMIAPSEANPEGYWENGALVHVNERVISARGGDWATPPTLPDPASEEWREDETLVALTEEARAAVSQLETSGPWGWKDPRNSFTLPLWLHVLPDLEIVACVRSPLEVALSLERVGACDSTEEGLRLWKTYNARILETAPAKRTIFTHWDAFFDHPGRELNRLAKRLGIEPTESAVAEATAAVRPVLRHSRFTSRDLSRFATDRELVELYDRLCDAAGWKENGGGPSRRRGKGSSRGTSPDAAAEGALEFLSRELSRIAVAVGAAQKEAESANQEIAEVVRSIAAVRDDYEELHRLASRSASASEEALEVSRGSATTSQQALEAARSSASTSQEAVEAARSSASTLEEALGALRETVSEQAAVRSSALRLENELADVLERVEGIETELAELRLATTADLSETEVDYRLTVGRLRRFVRSAVPKGSRMLVVSKGDHDLVSFPGRTALHFPQDETGAYTGYYPASSLAAIAHLEGLRAAGAEYLLIPETYRWWLDHYHGLARHLRRRYVVAADHGGVGILFALSSNDRAQVWDALRETVADLEQDLQRPPAVLDWSRYDVAREFPEWTVFSPQGNSSELPYLDETVDLVVVDADNSRARLSEARRVARAAVVRIARGDDEDQVDVEHTSPGHASQEEITLVVPAPLQHAAGGALSRSLSETLRPAFAGEILTVGNQNGTAAAGSLGEWWAEASAIASGDVLVFLGASLTLLPGWLEPLHRTLSHAPDAGIVGARILSSSGRLLHAGGILADDGEPSWIGDGEENPEAPAHARLRSVPCVGPWLVATRRDLLTEVGGLDRTKAGAADMVADYCVRAERLGRMTYYEPDSVAVLLAEADREPAEPRVSA